MLFFTPSPVKSSTRFAGGCVFAKSFEGLSFSFSGRNPFPVVCGRPVLIRFGLPIFVCFGVDARGGGSFGVFREWSVCSTSGADDSCMCISLLDSVASPLRAGDAIGDEKMPDTGSRPYSSRMPLSGSVIPVLLPRCQLCRFHPIQIARAYRPTLPTSKYCCSCAFFCRCRPGVMLFLLLAIPGGGLFSLSSSRLTV